MVGKSRFGGIFSILSRRDVNVIKTAEAHLLSDEDFGGDVPLEEGLDDLSIDEVIEGVKLYIEYFRQERVTGYMDSPGNYKEMVDWQKTLSPERKVEWAEMQRQARYWQAQLQPILKKLKRAQTKLQNEELS